MHLHEITGCSNQARVADVLFVHGLGGDKYLTWQSADAEASWMHWLGGDFPDLGIWSLEYPASPSRWMGFGRWFGMGAFHAGHTMALPDRAGQVLDNLIQVGIGTRPVMFICHSLGGLLVKQILRKSSDAPHLSPKRKLIEQTRAVLFLATPHIGSELATFADKLKVVLGSTVTIEELRYLDHNLRDLYDWYRAQSERLRITTASYFETLPIKGFVIVDPASAHPGVGDGPVALDENHISIAKPSSKKTQVYAAAHDLVRTHLITPSIATPSSRESNSREPATPLNPIEIVHSIGYRNSNVVRGGNLGFSITLKSSIPTLVKAFLNHPSIVLANAPIGKNVTVAKHGVFNRFALIELDLAPKATYIDHGEIEISDQEWDGVLASHLRICIFGKAVFLDSGIRRFCDYRYESRIVLQNGQSRIEMVKSSLGNGAG